jgi:uncharacterized OB-fold protein
MTVYPDIDPDSEPFWAATRQHRLIIQRCTSCSTVRFPPRPVCAVCASTAFEWIDEPGCAHLVSWCVARHPFHPEFRDVPYAVLLVELDDHAGVSMYGNFHGDVDRLVAGLPLQAVFDDVAEDLTLVNWAPRDRGRATVSSIGDERRNGTHDDLASMRLPREARP